MELSGDGKTINWPVMTFQSALIVLIVVGHINNDGFNGPFNILYSGSFYVAGFSFVSGYLYSANHDGALGNYLIKRVQRLFIPLIGINFVYGAITCLLNSLAGFSLVGSPFPLAVIGAATLGINQCSLIHPTWFIAPFFLSQCVFVAFRALLAKFDVTGGGIDRACLIIFLPLGVIPIIIGGKTGIGPGLGLLLARTAFMLPWHAFGRYYKAFLEIRIEKIKSPSFFVLLLILQLILLYLCSGPNTYAQYACRFPHGVIITYLSTLVGIAIYWRACEVIAPRLGKGAAKRLVKIIGENTFSIMCHHVFGFFLINCAFAVSFVVFGAFGSFDMVAFKANVQYAYWPHGVRQFGLLYAFMGISVSLLIHMCWTRFKKLVSLRRHCMRDIMR